MRRLKALWTELKARRRGRKMMRSNFGKATRHIIGPTGYNYSSAWRALEEDDGTYMKSFDPRIPPSTFVSARDLTRANQPIPLAERRIEAFHEEETPLLSEEDLEKLRKGVDPDEKKKR